MYLKDFYTNVSVAWFTAGIIAPIFGFNYNLKNLSAILISVVMCMLFLLLARSIELNKND